MMGSWVSMRKKSTRVQGLKPGIFLLMVGRAFGRTAQVLAGYAKVSRRSDMG